LIVITIERGKNVFSTNKKSNNYNKTISFMKTKSKCTTYDRAIQEVEGFSSVFTVMRQNTAIGGRADSTFYNYIHRIALVSLHFNRLPEAITDAELTEYLTTLALDASSPSRSGFKHTVYGLRYYFRHIGLEKRAIDLPSLKKASKLPVVLNQKELRKLFHAPTLPKHRILLALAYSAGLRAQELCNLKLGDIDYERMSIHVRQGKGRKDRMVPLANYMAEGLRGYIAVEKPNIWLFNGKSSNSNYSSRGISSVMREALKKTSITKEASIHTLRHSYATHLLEQGVNIVTIKNLLGHAEIATTMVYLHIAQCPLVPAHSPLDTLYLKSEWQRDPATK
jgi:site-specific recombinase XerD